MSDAVPPPGDDAAEATDSRPPDFTVDGRFTSEGLSVSVYDDDGAVVDEAWFTYAEIKWLAGDEASDFTFELEVGD